MNGEEVTPDDGISEEAAIRDSYQVQIDILVNFVRQLMYHRALKEVVKEFKHNFWIYIFNNHLEMAILQWCKLFGVNAEHTHWSNVFIDKDGFRQQILDAVGMNKEQWKKYWEELKDYRNEWVSHFNPDFKPDRHPDLEPALQAVIACYGFLLSTLDQYSIEHQYPPSLKDYAGKVYEQAIVFASKAYGGTKGLPENVG